MFNRVPKNGGPGKCTGQLRADGLSGRASLAEREPPGLRRRPGEHYRDGARHGGGTGQLHCCVACRQG